MRVSKLWQNYLFWVEYPFGAFLDISHMKAINKNKTYILAKTYPTIFPFSSSAMYDSWKTNAAVQWSSSAYDNQCLYRSGSVSDLWPGQAVVEVVLHLIVLWKTQQVTVLHVHQILWLETCKWGNNWATCSNTESFTLTTLAKTNRLILIFREKLESSHV